MPIPGDSGIIPENKASIETPTSVFLRQHRDARPCLDLMGGTEAMRRAGSVYIPQKEAETARAYHIRVDRTVLRNAFSQTIGYYRGQVFSREISLDNKSSDLTDDQMGQFSAWAEDVDQRGHNLTAWSGAVFTAGLVSGVTFALVDYPHIETTTEGGVTMYRAADGTMRPKTAAADASEGWSPYLVHIPAEQVLDCRAEWRKGRRVITHFRYLETRQESSATNPWAMEDVQYIHAYWIDRWELWRSDVDTGQTSADFQKVAEGQMTLDEIPVAVYMPGDARSDFTARPALMDLAWLNIEHWRATSEQRDLLAYVRLPVWTITGAERKVGKNNELEPIPFGPGNIVYLSPGGSLQSAGVNPGSVEDGRQDLRDLEDAMATYGLQIMQAQSAARMTATEVDKMTREGNSQLKNWALDYKDFLENVLRLVAKWWGMPDGPSAEVNDDYADNASIDPLIQLHDKGIIGKETLAAFAVRLGVLPDDFNYQDEVARMAQDAATAANAGTSFGISLAQRLGVGAGSSGKLPENPGNSGAQR